MDALMRKYLFMLAAGALAICACTREINVETPVEEGEEMTFTAYAEDSEQPDTKTVVRNRTKIYLSAKEQVSLFYGNGSGGGTKFTSTNTSPSAVVDFTGKLASVGTANGSTYYWGIYPYSTANAVSSNVATLSVPASQTAVAGSFAAGSYPSVAKSLTTGLRFYNVCGGLILKISDTSIQSVSIKGNNNEILAGTVKIAFNSSNRPVVQSVVSAAKEVTLKAPAAGFSASAEYFVALLPCTLSKGFTLTFTKSGATASKSSSRSQTIKRSVFGNLGVCDKNISWPSDTSSPVDLGLSVNWSSKNLGASSESSLGFYYAWGEISNKSSYSWNNYRYCAGQRNSLTKYCFNKDFGYDYFIDNKDRLDPDDDAAQSQLGGNWRMPTQLEVIKLKEK